MSMQLTTLQSISVYLVNGGPFDQEALITGCFTAPIETEADKIYLIEERCEFEGVCQVWRRV